jgi:hypothetical protein
VSTAPAPTEPERKLTPTPIAAAWLGRPLSPSGPHALLPAPPRSAFPRRPPPIERAALFEKLRDADLASTQPPPADLFTQPAVPRPPRLPRESSRPAPVSIPPRAAGARGGTAGRVDPRKEEVDDEETWTEDTPTLGPPPWDPPAGIGDEVPTPILEERARLLADYLAERAPSPPSHAPSPPRRTQPIPREEPSEDTLAEPVALPPLDDRGSAPPSRGAPPSSSRP